MHLLCSVSYTHLVVEVKAEKKEEKPVKVEKAAKVEKTEHAEKKEPVKTAVSYTHLPGKSEAVH